MLDTYTILRLKYLIRHNKIFILALCLVITIFSIMSYFIIKGLPIFIRSQKLISSSSYSYNQIINTFIQGNYQRGIVLLKEALKNNPEDEALKNLYALFTEKLLLNVKLHYYLGRKYYRTTTQITPSLILTPRDPYYLTVTPSRRCYLYIFQIDSLGKIEVLYPNKNFSSGGNPVMPGKLRIPDGFRWLKLDKTRGIETIYILATPIENKRLLKLSGSQLIEYLESLDNAVKDLPGIAFKVYQFTHG